MVPCDLWFKSELIAELDIAPNPERFRAILAAGQRLRAVSIPGSSETSLRDSAAPGGEAISRGAVYPERSRLGEL